MNDAQGRPDGLPETQCEFGVGVHVLMEGGEEDNTVRPAPAHMLPPESPNYRPTDHRKASIERQTGETRIELSLALYGSGKSTIATGVGFFDHMLTLLARHSLIDLTVLATGDLHVDAHHTVEDVGICFGKVLAEALGSKAGVRRYGDATVPMDETLATAAVDLCGLLFCVWKADVPLETLVYSVRRWRKNSGGPSPPAAAFALHVVVHHGRHTYHIIEAIFKATALALREAVELDPRSPGVPSTKGVL